MKVSIMSPRTRQELEVERMHVVTPTGEHVILPGHAPAVWALAQGSSVTCTVVGGSTHQVSVVHAGVLLVDRQSARVVVSDLP